jgi:hypothetical protein
MGEKMTLYQNFAFLKAVVSNSNDNLRLTNALIKPQLTYWKIWNMSIALLGINFGWGLQMANMRAIHERLGAKPSPLPIL